MSARFPRLLRQQLIWQTNTCTTFEKGIFRSHIFSRVKSFWFADPKLFDRKLRKAQDEKFFTVVRGKTTES